MDAYLGEDFDYAKLSSTAQSYVDQIVSGLSAEFIDGFDTADDLYNWIKTNIVDAFKNKDVVDAVEALSNLQVKFRAGDITYSDYINQLNGYLDILGNYLDENAVVQLKVSMGVDEEALAVDANHIKSLFVSMNISAFYVFS